jgi:hypothetical protein
MSFNKSADVLCATSNMENLEPSSSTENTSQNMFIRTDKICDIINDLDSDGDGLVNILIATHAK